MKRFQCCAQYGKAKTAFSNLFNSQRQDPSFFQGPEH